MDFPELLVILAVAFIFLGPEKMMEVATKLGDFLRKVRETWDELRYQLYMENINKKIMEESKDTTPPEDESLYDLIEEDKREEVKEDNGESRTSQDAIDGAPEGTKKQAD